jgi:hypothetical protein
MAIRCSEAPARNLQLPLNTRAIRRSSGRSRDRVHVSHERRLERRRLRDFRHKGQKNRLWAAAVPQHCALDEVQRLLPSGWQSSLGRRQLSEEKIAELNIRSGSVRELKSSP